MKLFKHLSIPPGMPAYDRSRIEFYRKDIDETVFIKHGQMYWKGLNKPVADIDMVHARVWPRVSVQLYMAATGFLFRCWYELKYSAVFFG